MAEDAIPDSLRAHLALALIPGLGPKLTAALLEQFGSPEAALKAKREQLESIPKIGTKLATQFAKSFGTVSIDAEWALIRKHRVDVSLITEADYPAPLRGIPDAPALLYRRGAFAEVDRNAIGIVGSRACTEYGRRTAAQLAASFARAGWTVISGLAYGIDRSAHEGAIKAGGRTIAVLAGGLASIYPRDHIPLAEECVQHGAIVTETPMTVAPQPGMFPARNRIISGLSRGIVVIEANLRSGALITATHAAEQGREVFVIPGNVDSPASAGCLDLIRKGARLVRNADDILEDLQGIAAPSQPLSKTKTAPPIQQQLFDEPAPAPAIPTGLDEKQLAVWQKLESTKHADELARELSMSPGELSVIVMKLEMKKLVRRLPGNHFERRS